MSSIHLSDNLHSTLVPEGISSSTHQPFADLEPLKEATFNQRQWLNNTLGKVAVTDMASQLPSIAQFEDQASRLCSQLQIHAQDLNIALEESITQTLIRLPRAALEISRMSKDSAIAREQIRNINSVVTPIAQSLPPEAVKIEELQQSKEKLLWCRSVLKTAQTIAQEVVEVGASLQALGMSSGSGAGVSEANSIKRSNPNDEGGSCDVEHIAKSIKHLNASLRQLQAIDPTYGIHFVQKIKNYEIQLQQSVERDCLDAIRQRSTLVRGAYAIKQGRAGSTLFLTLQPMEPIPLRLDNNTPKLFSILRAIQRDSVALDLFVSTSVDHLTAVFTSHVLSNKPSPSNIIEKTSQSTSSSISPSLRAFFRYTGSFIGNESRLLSILFEGTLSEGKVGGMSSTDGKGDSALPPVIMPKSVQKMVMETANESAVRNDTLNGAQGGVSPANWSTSAVVMYKGSLREAQETIMDTISIIVKRTVDNISRPLQQLLKQQEMPSKKGALSQQQRQSYRATMATLNMDLVVCLESAQEEIQPMAEKIASASDKPSKTTTANHANNTPSNEREDNSNSQLLISPVKTLPRAMGITASRTFAHVVETFIMREKEGIECYIQARESGATTHHSQSESVTDEIHDLILLVDNLEESLARCSKFFPQETVQPFLNSWSRHMVTVLHRASKECEEEIKQQVHPVTSRSNVAAIPYLTISNKACILRNNLIKTSAVCFDSFISNGKAEHGSGSVIDVDVLQSAFKAVEVASIHTSTVAEKALVTVLVRPLALLMKEYSKLSVFQKRGPDALEREGGKKAIDVGSGSAQTRKYTPGHLGYSSQAHSISEYFLDIPQVIERLNAFELDHVGGQGPSEDGGIAHGGESNVESLPLTAAALLAIVIQEGCHVINSEICFGNIIYVETPLALETLRTDLQFIQQVLDSFGDTSVTHSSSGDEGRGDNDSQVKLTHVQEFNEIVRRVDETFLKLEDEEGSTIASDSQIFPFYLSEDMRKSATYTK